MKKVFLVLFAVVASSGVVFADLNLKFGIDMGGALDAEVESASGYGYTGYGGAGKDSWDVDGGITLLIAEYLFNIKDVVKIGAGFEYQIARARETGSSFNFIPLYVSAQVHPIAKARGIYGKLNLGKNISFSNEFGGSSNEKGGFYWAIGGGYTFPFGLILELLYGTYKGSYETNGGIWEFDVSYSKLALNAGYRFKI